MKGDELVTLERQVFHLFTEHASDGQQKCKQICIILSVSSVLF